MVYCQTKTCGCVPSFLKEICMNVLIVFAHPEARSFNGALKDTAVDTLTDQGHNVQVSDLYSMRWKSQLDQHDIPGERNSADFFNAPAEQEKMERTTGATPDVRTEQEKMQWCDLMIFQFPVWWFGMPAILKGWVDRTFTRGFAYKSGQKYDSGVFRGKRAMICATTGTASSLYEPDGIDGDINHILWPIHNGIFHYAGFDVLPPFMAWSADNTSPTVREGYLNQWADRLKGIGDEKPLYFHSREDYGQDQRLRPGVAARTGFQWNPSAGQTHDDAARTYVNNLKDEGY